MPFKVLESLFHHPLTDAGLARFAEDYRKSQEARGTKDQAAGAATKS